MGFSLKKISKAVTEPIKKVVSQASDVYSGAVKTVINAPIISDIDKASGGTISKVSTLDPISMSLKVGSGKSISNETGMLKQIGETYVTGGLNNQLQSLGLDDYTGSFNGLAQSLKNMFDSKSSGQYISKNNTVDTSTGYGVLNQNNKMLYLSIGAGILIFFFMFKKR